MGVMALTEATVGMAAGVPVATMTRVPHQRTVLSALRNTERIIITDRGSLDVQIGATIC